MELNYEFAKHSGDLVQSIGLHNVLNILGANTNLNINTSLLSADINKMPHVFKLNKKKMYKFITLGLYMGEIV